MPNYHHYNRSGKITTDVGSQTFDNLTSDMQALCKKGSGLGITPATPEVIGKSAVGKQDILAIKLGKKQENRVLLIGCHHAREWISVEVPFLVAKYLIDNYDPAAKTPKAKRIKYLVDEAEIWIVPLLNVDGHMKTFQPGELFWRPNTRQIVFSKDVKIERWVETAPITKTKDPVLSAFETRTHRLQPTGTGTKHIVTIAAGSYEGVDLNRNYPVPAGAAGQAPAWGVETCGIDPNAPGGLVQTWDTSRKPEQLMSEAWDLTTSRTPSPPDVFCGPSAGSEPEVDVVVKLIGKGNFKCQVHYHSKGQLILYADDAAADKDTQFLGKGFLALFKAAKADYEYKPAGGFYPTSGGSLDWGFRLHKTPNYVIELSPTAEIADKNNWNFNRLPPAEIERVFKENLPAALAAINCSISGLTPGPIAKAPAPAAVKVVKQCWKALLGWTP
jgi:Zinc carboxypeptidase